MNAALSHREYLAKQGSILTKQLWNSNSIDDISTTSDFRRTRNSFLQSKNLEFSVTAPEESVMSASVMTDRMKMTMSRERAKVQKDKRINKTLQFLEHNMVQIEE